MMKPRLSAKNRSGTTLVLVAASLVAIFGFAALAVDVGMIGTAKSQARKAAEAGALAGAAIVQQSTVFTTADSSWAVAKADSFAEMNSVLSQLVGPSEVQAVVIDSLSRVRVTVTRPSIALTFARALGFQTKSVTESAAAAVMTAPAASCIQQFALPDTIPFDPPDSGAVVHPIWIEQSDTLTIIGFFGSPPGVGNLLIGPGCQSSTQIIYTDSTVPAKPGNTVTGPTRDGMLAMICYDIQNGITPLLYTPGVGFTRDGVPEPNWRSDARVATVALYNPSTVLGPGTTNITITGFINVYFSYMIIQNGTNTTTLDGTSISDCNHSGGSNIQVYGRIFVAKGVDAGTTSSICDPTKAIPCVLKLVE